MKIGFDVIVKNSITWRVSENSNMNEFQDIARDETEHAKFANAMHLEEEEQKFWMSSVVQHYLLDIIEEHYPESQSPCWVDRKKFVFYMKRKIFEELWEVLEDDFADFADDIEDYRRSEFYLTKHLFAYISGYIYIDDDDFERKLQDHREIEITDKVWGEYFKVKRKPEEDSDDDAPEENSIPIPVTKVEKTRINAENIVRRLKERYPPMWYILEKEIGRDDVYEGMKRLFPEELENVGWGDFWEALSPFICDWSGPMYIRLKDLWKSPISYVAVVSNLPFVICPSQLMEFLGEEIWKEVEEETRQHSGHIRLYLKNEQILAASLALNGKEMCGRTIRVQKWEDFTIDRDEDCYLGGNVWGV